MLVGLICLASCPLLSVVTAQECAVVVVVCFDSRWCSLFLLRNQATMGLPVVVCAFAPLLRTTEQDAENPETGYYPPSQSSTVFTLIVSKMLRVALLQVGVDTGVVVASAKCPSVPCTRALVWCPLPVTRGVAAMSCAGNGADAVGRPSRHVHAQSRLRDISPCLSWRAFAHGAAVDADVDQMGQGVEDPPTGLSTPGVGTAAPSVKAFPPAQMLMVTPMIVCLVVCLCALFLGRQLFELIRPPIALYRMVYAQHTRFITFLMVPILTQVRRRMVFVNAFPRDRIVTVVFRAPA